MQRFTHRDELVRVLVSHLPLHFEQFVPCLLVLAEGSIQQVRYEVLHLVLGLAINDLEGLLGQLDRARIRVLVFKHDLDDVVDLNITAITDHVLHHLDRPVLVIFFLVNLLHAATSVASVLGEINRLLKLEFLQQPKEEECQLDLVILEKTCLLGLLTALLNKALRHVLRLLVHHG